MYPKAIREHIHQKELKLENNDCILLMDIYINHLTAYSELTVYWNTANMFLQ